MINLLSGAIAIIGVVVFLGNYAFAINSLPLWIIVVGVLAMPVADYLMSLRGSADETCDDDQREP